MNIERGSNLTGRPVEGLTGEQAQEEDGLAGPRYVLAGARVQTRRGLRPIEELDRGDLILTARGDLVAVVSVERFLVDAVRLMERPDLAPVLIDAGALGNLAAFGVSPRHPVGVMPLRDGRVDPDGTGKIRTVRDLLGTRPGLRAMPEARRIEYVRLTTERQAYVLVEGVPIVSNGPDCIGARPVVMARPTAVSDGATASVDLPPGPGIVGPILLGWLAGASAFAATLVSGGGAWLGAALFVLTSGPAVICGAVLAAFLSERRRGAQAVPTDRAPDDTRAPS
jgi:hypothetical protein